METNNYILSSLIYPLSALENDNFLYISSGFLYRSKEKFYFITSLGSVLGRSVPNGYFKLNSKKIPTHFKTKFSVFQKDLVSINKKCFSVHIPLYDDKFEPNFYIHPTYKKEVDIAVFPIDPQGQDLVALNDFDTLKKEEGEDEVIVIGYPLFPNESDDRNNPVYAEGKILKKEKNVLLINTINRNGFFGAAVFKKTDLNQNSFCFIGVFSGNHPSPIKEQPLVWDKTLIEEIIQAQYKESCLD